jgi:probable rRNA maturation factor
MIKVEIQADSKYPINRKRIRETVQNFLGERGISNDLEVGVIIVGDRKMRELNKKYLKVEGTTDVLSFSQVETTKDDPLLHEPSTELGYLGDVVVSWPQALKQAIERNKVVDEEVDFLIQHGILHLLGIHHD